MIKEYVRYREDMDILFINYNDILSNPKENICKIMKFINTPNNLLGKMKETVDKKIYRQRRT
jgi:hypothetical protein